MPWLADPSQTPPPSWLTSPTVTFLGFVATIISIVQAVVAVGKWVRGIAGKEDARRRFSTYFATACVAASAILAPVTWTAVVNADIGTGDPHWVSELYPVVLVLMVVSGSFWIVVFDLPAKKRPSLAACAQIAIGLTSPALALNLTIASAWERSFVDVVPALAFTLAIPMFLSYAMRKKPGSNKILDVRSGSAT